MTKRCKFNITVEVDLDTFHNVEDWKHTYKKALLENPHCNTVVTIEEVPIVSKEIKYWYVTDIPSGTSENIIEIKPDDFDKCSEDELHAIIAITNEDKYDGLLVREVQELDGKYVFNDDTSAVFPNYISYGAALVLFCGILNEMKSD